MSNHTPDAPRPLPDRPDLRHLRNQAKDLLKAGAKSLAEAQFQIARLYGFISWPKLKAHVESLREVGQLKRAIDTNNFERIKALMTTNPELHRAPLGYGKNGPLTWVAECRVPWEPPSPVRLAIAEWMIANGSDVHQGGDGPLMRAALSRDRVPMMELLVAHGADVNASWNGNFPILFASCEVVNAVPLRWLLEHGADPNCPGSKDTALDYLMATYGRSPELAECIDLLARAGGRTRCDAPGVMEILRGRIDELGLQLNRDPELIDRHFPELDFGSTGARRLLLTGGTLLHVAAEFGNVEAARVLLAAGASVNAKGASGQTPIFHSVTQFRDYGLELTRVLIDAGADLSIRTELPGHYERQDDNPTCTPLGYAMRYPGDKFNGSNEKTIALLRQHGAAE